MTKYIGKLKMKKVAILQSNYIPWKGYFDLIASVDEFIIYDDVQYTPRDWRNRNQIKTSQGKQWLTVPVKKKGRRHQKINETEILDSGWEGKHWKSLVHAYSKTPYFNEIASWLEPLYLQNKYTHISSLNYVLIKAICAYVGIDTIISHSSDYELSDGKTQRLVDLCTQASASEYISGPAAKDYIEQNLFDNNKIKLSWFDYSHYPEYPQLWGEFTHQVSILDLLFNTGKNACNYMKHVNNC